MIKFLAHLIPSQRQSLWQATEKICRFSLNGNIQIQVVISVSCRTLKPKVFLGSFFHAFQQYVYIFNIHTTYEPYILNASWFERNCPHSGGTGYHQMIPDTDSNRTVNSIVCNNYGQSEIELFFVKPETFQILAWINLLRHHEFQFRAM